MFIYNKIMSMRIFFITICIISLSGLTKVQENYNTIVGIVNNEVITHSQVVKAADNVNFKKSDLVNKDLYFEILNNIIDDRIMLHIGRQIMPNISEKLVTNGIDNLVRANKLAQSGVELKNKDINTYNIAKQEIKNELWRQTFIANIIFPIMPINNQEIEKILDKNTNIQIYQIMLDSNKKNYKLIKKIREDVIKKPKLFPAIAKKYSQSNSAKTGGDLGFIKKNELPKFYISTIENLAINEISPILEFNEGLHMLKVSSKTIDISREQAIDIYKEQNYYLYMYEWLISSRDDQYVVIFPEKIKNFVEVN